MKKGTLTSLIAKEIRRNMKGVQNLRNQYRGRVGFFGKKLEHICNKRGVEGRKNRQAILLLNMRHLILLPLLSGNFLDTALIGWDFE